MKYTNKSISPFALQVYAYVRTIAPGQTRTYAEVATAIGRPGAARAVGNALNKNPFAPEVPCHRVIRSDGSLGGFAWGKKKKSALLKKEGAVFSGRGS